MSFITHSSILRRGVAGGLVLGGVFALADDRLTVPVQSLTPPPATNTMMATQQPVEAPPQVTPAARMPQYQLHRTDHTVISQPESASIRFLLATPKRPVLIEALITIDGQPYAQAREQRIQKMASFVADPVAFREQLVPVTLPTTPPAPPPSVAIDVAATVPETPQEPIVAAIPKYAPPATIYDRIERHMKSTGTKPSAGEIRWMLANWTDGPVLLFLNDNFQRFRSAQQPLFAVLDSNRDGVLSVDEISGAVKTLESCDLDRNEVVESTEIAKVSSDPRNRVSVNLPSHPLVLRLDLPSAMSGLLPRLIECYPAAEAAEALGGIDANRDGALSEEERQSVLERPADLVLQVDFDNSKPETSRLTVISATDSSQADLNQAVNSGKNLLLAFPGYVLELSAVQGEVSDQVSIGAVNDGYSMLPELDSNGDGRFTIRELRTLVDRLQVFDRNGDGSIAADESLPTFRLCLGLGASAHQPLSVLRQANPPDAPDTAAPDWFVQMDKNKDFDLSRNEFPGTDEQYRKLDSDSDQLISHTEASQADF